MIVLVGFMGAGKTTVGRILAERLGTDFVDVDEEIERESGSSIAELFASGGEDAFRALEVEAVLRALASGAGVVALGGGALTSAEVRSALSGATVVHLDVSPAEVRRRVGDDAGRPLLAGDLQTLFESRRPLYEEAADLRMSTDGRTPEEVASELATLVSSR